MRMNKIKESIQVLTDFQCDVVRLQNLTFLLDSLQLLAQLGDLNFSLLQP